MEISSSINLKLKQMNYSKPDHKMAEKLKDEKHKKEDFIFRISLIILGTTILLAAIAAIVVAVLY